MQPDDRALEAYSRFVSRRARGDGASFADFVAAHPEISVQLHALDERYRDWQSVLERLSSESRAADTEAKAAMDSKSGRPDSLLWQLKRKLPRSDRYQLLGEIGRGGMGVVVKVWDEELQRHLAMKVVLGTEGEDKAGQGASQPDPRTLGRFLEEAQITGQLEHPCIVPVHELGLGADGQVYFTMRLVKGEDLRSIFDRVVEGADGWNLARALNVLLKACEAMSYAHDKGVVHRDLKPANIMVGRYGEVYVMDWGLARVVGRSDAHDLRLKAQEHQSVSVNTVRRMEREEAPDSPLVTMDGDVVGTPSYMSPEQARGDVAQVGPLSDVYSLGAILYHLLAARSVAAPYAPKGARLSPHSILGLVVNGPPTALSEIAPDAPPELVAIADRAMERDPAARYESMGAMAADLRAYLEGRVVLAFESGSWASLRKWIGRNRALSAASLSAIVALVAGTIISSKLATEANGMANVARAASQELSLRNEQLRAQARELRFRTVLVELDQLRTRVSRSDWLERAAILVEGNRQGSPEEWTPGLADVRARLGELRASPDVAPWSEYDKQLDFETHPFRARLRDLEAAKAAAAAGSNEQLRILASRILWAKRMAGDAPWPSVEEARAKVATVLASDDMTAMEREAWALLGRGEDRKYGDEMAAWLLASKAHELARAKGPSEIAALHCFALVSIGRLDEAGAVIRAEIQRADGPLRAGLVAQESALMPQAERLRDPDSLRAGISQLEEQLVRDSRLNAEKSAGLLAALEPRIARLHEACSARRTWRFADASSQWWHDQLAEAELALSDLGDQVRIARESLHSPKAQARWMEALQEIPKLPSYSRSELLRAGRFTPQPGLLPLGVNPRSGLWEFVHLETGTEPACDADGRVVRDAEGRLSLSAETGLVFILVPGGKLPIEAPPPGQLVRQDMDASAVELAPYFLSKYEMTQFQWDRCADDPYTIVHPNDALLPAASLSWPAARATLSKLLGSPTLPSHVQWELACRGGTTTYWWTGAEPTSLVGRENVRVQGEQAAPCRAIGTGEPNPFGFHDMHGNVWEWTHDALLVDYERPVLVHAKGDGVLDRPGAAFRKIAGGSSEYDADQARSSFTTAVTAGHAVGDLGLRPAMRIARAEH